MVAAILLCGMHASAGQSNPALQPGDTYEITMTRETSQRSGNASSGSSHDRDTLIERVIGLRLDGIEFEYDLPPGVTKQQRTAQWQFPVRVLRPFHGPMQLLNRPELEARVEAWLKAANWTRDVCGHWIFTWNAFQIDCDPESVIEKIEAFDLSVPDVREGGTYRDKLALNPGPLVEAATGPEGASFTASMQIDPDAVRRERAQGDVVVGEILREPITLEKALANRKKETVSGAIFVTLQSDPAGNVWRRNKVINTEIRNADGQLEANTINETMEKRLVSQQPL